MKSNGDHGKYRRGAACLQSCCASFQDQRLGSRMAKELPYFKFEPSAWDSGNIQLCTWEAKGLFIELCGLYWQRLGELPYALALQKLCRGNASLLQELKDNDIIGVVDNQICIVFLDEQLNEFGSVSEKRRNAAKKRWSDASAMQVHDVCNAIREEKIREEESRVDEIIEKKTKNSLMSDATHQDISERNKEFFEISKAWYQLFLANSESLGIRWQHLEKVKAETFINPIRLLIEQDKRTVEELRKVWNFLKIDDFWKPNIQSTSKLREKFDQLITKSNHNGQSNKQKNTEFINQLSKTSAWKDA